MIMKKTTKILLGLVLIGIVNPITANASSYWSQQNNIWYYLENGNKKTGWLNDNGTWYYLKEDGAMATGWILDKGNWYYFYSNGSMAHDTTIDGYYLNSSGAWTTNTASSSSSTGGVRTGAELLPKLYDLGFFDSGNNSMTYNPYGEKGLMTFNVMTVYAYDNSNNNDIGISIRKRTSDGDEKLKEILDSIIPNKGEELFDKIISNNKQTLYIDGRTIQIDPYYQYTMVLFSPKQ